MSYAVISYDYRNRADAMYFKAVLAENGIQAHMIADDMASRVGDNDDLCELVKNSDCFLLILSEEAQQEDSVRRETETAVRLGKPVVVVQTDNFAISNAFRLLLNGHKIFCTYWYSDQNGYIKDVVNAVKGFVRAQDTQAKEREKALEAAIEEKCGEKVLVTHLGTCGTYSMYRMITESGDDLKDIGIVEKALNEVTGNGPVRVYGKGREFYLEIPVKDPEALSYSDFMQEVWTDREKLCFPIGRDIYGNAVCEEACRISPLLVAGNRQDLCNYEKCIIEHVFKNYSILMSKIYVYDLSEKRDAADVGEYKNTVCSVYGTDELLKDIKMFEEEAEQRKKAFAEMSAQGEQVSNIHQYNRNAGFYEKRPEIVIFINGYGNAKDKEKLQELDKKLYELSRCKNEGIYLVMLADPDTVSAISGRIKVTFTSRICFKCSPVESKIVRDDEEAGKLTENGDILYSPYYEKYSRRLQSPVSTYDKDIVRLQPSRTLNVVQKLSEEELQKEAVRFAIENGEIRISFLQRKFCLGFPHAAKILDWMLENKYVKEIENGKKVPAVTMQEFKKIFGED